MQLPFRVVEVGDYGAYCGRILVDLGCEVIWLEPVGGSALRRAGPLLQPAVEGEGTGTGTGPGTPGMPARFLAAGKRSCCLALASAQGRLLADRLLQTVDLVIDGTEQGLAACGPELARWQLERGGAAPVAATPDPVYIRVSPFGASGPHANHVASSLVAYARGGQMYLSGLPGEEPILAPCNQDVVIAGLHAAMGALALLWARDARGDTAPHPPLSGEVAAIEAMASMDMILGYHSHLGHIPQRSGSQHRVAVPGRIYPCRDGHVHIFASDAQTGSWDRFVQWMGSPPSLTDPRYRNPLYRRQQVAEVDAVVKPHLATRSRQEIVESLQQMRIPAGPVLTPGEALADPQFVARGLAGTDSRGQPGLRPPFRWDGQYGTPQTVPAAGADSWAVLRNIGLADDDILTLMETGLVGGCDA